MENQFTNEILQKIYKAVENLPPEAIERAKKEDTRKGYDTTGYQYQFLVNVLNEVVGVNNWSNDYRIIKEIEGKWNNGKSFFEITIEMELTILGAKRKASGGHKSEMYFDAHKGAITNSIKKTLSLFSIGKRAFEGVLDEDYRPIPIQAPSYNPNAPQVANFKPQAKLALNQQPANVNVWGNCPNCGSLLAESKFKKGELYCTNYKEGCKHKSTINEYKQTPELTVKPEPVPEQEIRIDEIPF